MITLLGFAKAGAWIVPCVLLALAATHLLPSRHG